MTPGLLGVAAMCAVLAVIFLAVIVYIGRGKAEPVDPWRGSETPLYDRVAAELGVTPERPAPWSAGDETDIVQALRVAHGSALLEHRGQRSRRANLVRLPDRGAL